MDAQDSRLTKARRPYGCVTRNGSLGAHKPGERGRRCSLGSSRGPENNPACVKVARLLHYVGVSRLLRWRTADFVKENGRARDR